LEVRSQSEGLSLKLTSANDAIARLRQCNAEQEDTVAQLENELYQLKQEQEQAVECAVEKVEKELSAVKSAGREIAVQLRAQEAERQAANEQCAIAERMLESLRTETQSQMEIKDKRILHLEASKLTQDQLEKIKVMKEERKKFQEDAKTLKKQLARLKAAYDEMKENAESAKSKAVGSNSDFVISDLKFQVAELNAQFTQSQSITQSLKDKLRDCAKQLQEYETDRIAIISILDKHGVDTSGLSVADSSVSDISTAKDMAVAQDISDAVAKLAEKLMVAQSILTNRDSSKATKQRELEDKLSHLQAELDDVKATKLALERRLDGSKNALRVSRDEVAALTVEIENQKAKIDELKQAVMETEKKVVSSTDNVHSEIQVLEEENIELMRENKELRVEVSRIKAVLQDRRATAIAQPQQQLPDRDENTAPVEMSSHHSPLPSTAETEKLSSSALCSSVGVKRAFGRELDVNALSDTSFLDNTSNKMNSMTTKNLQSTAPGSENGIGTQQNLHKQRARAKALVSTTGQESAEEGAGECAQS